MRKNIILVGEPMAAGRKNNGAFGFAEGLGCGWGENCGEGVGMGVLESAVVDFFFATEANGWQLQEAGEFGDQNRIPAPAFINYSYVSIRTVRPLTQNPC
jgi:hypothetical protein